MSRKPHDPPRPIVNLLPFQAEVFWCAHRSLHLLWRRQAGKSHLFASKALSRMMLMKAHSVFIVNASLLMGQENIMKETQIWVSVLNAFREAVTAAGQELKVYEADYTEKGALKRAREVDTEWDVDTLAGLFEASKLEARVWHSRTVYSRSRVVAPNPLTARGYTGDVLGDEEAFWQEWEAVMDAIEWIIARNPRFIFWKATTPPMDESHPTFSLLMPKRDAFPVNPRGNWYFTEPEGGGEGEPVHRCDAFDAEAAGLPIYDMRTKEPLSVEKARSRARNRKTFDRNMLLKFISGGGAAIPRHLLLNAQAVDDGRCGLALDLGELGRMDDAA